MKRYHDMSDTEIEEAIRQIVASCSSEEEVRRRIRDELGYEGGLVFISHRPKDDASGRQARELVRVLGGLVMHNGDLAMAMFYGHEDIISI